MFIEHLFFKNTKARNLRRQVQKDLEDPIATKIIESYMSPITQLKASANDSKIELLAL